MEHPTVIKPGSLATWDADRMGKTTLYQSSRLLVGLNAFEPGQAHALHAHKGMDKVYYVTEGEGEFLLDGRQLPMRAGDLLVAPEGVAPCREVAERAGVPLTVVGEATTDASQRLRRTVNGDVPWTPSGFDHFTR